LRRGDGDARRQLKFGQRSWVSWENNGVGAWR
jgi:hypothetical protein